MLILTRDINESIIINGNIEVKYLRLNADGTIKLGISAPDNIIVDREEVHRKRNVPQNNSDKNNESSEAKPKPTDSTITANVVAGELI